MSTPTVSDTALRVSIEHLLEGVQVIGFDWRYVYLNETACRHGQRTREQLLGRTLVECYPGIEGTDLFLVLKRVMDSRHPERLLNEFVYPEGERGWFELLIEPVPDGICIVSVDITDRQRAQVHLRQVQKMEAIGRLAGGIAHDFNNVLTAILGYCELLLDRVGPESDLTRDINEIRIAGERAGGLTRQLLAFSRKQVLLPQVVDLNQVVCGVERMLSRVIGEDIRVEIVSSVPLRHTKADPGQIEQVLLNLAVNARDAMPEGGTLRVTTGNVDLNEAFARTHPGAVAGSYVALALSDTGCGIDRDVLPRVFEPFFTTKGPGKGTGLGLATVYGIVKQSGGYVWIDSTLGAGTTVTVYLPAVDEPIDDTTFARAATCTTGTETILLVEDELPVRSLMSRALKANGYVVLEAEDSDDAVVVAEKHPTPIDLLLTDIVMPGMNGPNLAQAVLRSQPGIKVLYVSGFPYTVLAGTSATSTRVSFLSKPFAPTTLLTAVRQSLDR